MVCLHFSVILKDLSSQLYLIFAAFPAHIAIWSLKKTHYFFYKDVFLDELILFVLVI